MKKGLLYFSLLLLLVSCNTDDRKSETADAKEESSTSLNENSLPLLTWYFETKPGEGELSTMPLTDIYIQIDNKRLIVIEEAHGEYYTLDNEDALSWKIPENSLISCLGGYGGLYRCLYVERDKNELTVKQAWSDAESEFEGLFDESVFMKIAL